MILIALTAAIIYFTMPATALDYILEGLGVTNDGEGGGFRRQPAPMPIDISQMNFVPDDWRLVYRFYYNELGMMDLDRHEVVDELGFVRLITHADGVLSVHTYAHAVFDWRHDEDADMVIITALSPRTRYSSVVMLDAGHGGHDAGAEHGGLRESDVNLDITMRVYALFAASQSGIRAYLTRHDDSFVSMQDRAVMGNMSADLLVSIHNNAYDGPTRARVSGTEVLFAASSVMDRYGNEGRANISNAAFSQIMQNHLVNTLGTRDRGIVQRSGLALLNLSAIPLAYLEIEFMTSTDGLASLRDPNFLQSAAQAIYDGIVATLSLP